jgi:hypothetical protein
MIDKGGSVFRMEIQVPRSKSRILLMVGKPFGILAVVDIKAGGCMSTHHASIET